MCASAFYISNIEKSLEEHGLSMCTIVANNHANLSWFCGDHSTCTQPARVQEALAPQVHCDERPDTKSAKLCFSVTNIDWSLGESTQMYTPDTQKINKQMVSTGSTHCCCAWTTWCHQKDVFLHFQDQQQRRRSLTAGCHSCLQQYHKKCWKVNGYREVDYRVVLVADEHS